MLRARLSNAPQQDLVTSAADVRGARPSTGVDVFGARIKAVRAELQRFRRQTGTADRGAGRRPARTRISR